jgi:formamidopyrimidine-DNA glycosylase
METYIVAGSYGNIYCDRQLWKHILWQAVMETYIVTGGYGNIYCDRQLWKHIL